MSQVATAPRVAPIATDRLPAGVGRRAALLRRLTSADHQRLVVIVAPPGYGKSTLLSEWEAHDSRRFVSVCRAPAELRTPPTMTESIEWALESIRSSSRPCVLVLDDSHLLDALALRRLADQALHELPACSALALASRTEPELPLGRLRAARTLIELGADDLALSSGEAATLLQQAGLDLDVRAVENLVQRTEGWPTALYLAALSLRNAADASAAVQELRGDDHRLSQYFRDEILSGLSGSQTEFAVRTSVLAELSGALCDAVLGGCDSGVMLSALAKACPLLRPVDAAHERYRWHGLVRDALQAELRRTERRMAPTLHIRASSWYTARGDSATAIGHAVAAHDCKLSGDLLWATVAGYIAQGRNPRVQKWLAEFSDHEILRHPRLGLSAAYSAIAAGDAAKARHLTVAVAAGLQRAEADDAAGALGAGLAGIEALLGYGEVPAMATASARACALEPSDGPWRPIYLFLRGTSLYLSGRPGPIERMLEEAAGLSAAPAPAVTSLCLAQLAMAAIGKRDWETASDLTDRSREVIEARDLDEYPVCALPFAALAAVGAHAGMVDQAKRDLRRGIDLLARLGDHIPWYGAETRILLANASLGLADVLGARTLLAEASRLARRTRGAVIFEQWFDASWSDMDALAEENLAGPSSLTIAELRILRFLPSHRSFREIAELLDVSPNTVKTQAHAVYRKLGAASRSEAVARGANAGLVSH